MISALSLCLSSCRYNYVQIIRALRLEPYMAATINQSRWMIYVYNGIYMYIYVCAGYLQVVKTRIAQRTQSDFKSIIWYIPSAPCCCLRLSGSVTLSSRTRAMNTKRKQDRHTYIHMCVCVCVNP